MGVPAITLFDTSALTSGRPEDERAVVHCLLVLAKTVCKKYGIEPPEIVMHEMQIEGDNQGEGVVQGSMKAANGMTSQADLQVRIKGKG